MVRSYQEIVKEIKLSNLSDSSKKILIKYSYNNYNRHIKTEKFSSDEEVLNLTCELSKKIGLVKNNNIDIEFLKTCGRFAMFNVAKVKTIINKFYNNNGTLNKHESELINEIKKIKLINSNNGFEYNKDLVKVLVTEIVKMFKYDNYKSKTFLISKELKSSDINSHIEKISTF